MNVNKKIIMIRWCAGAPYKWGIFYELWFFDPLFNNLKYLLLFIIITTICVHVFYLNSTIGTVCLDCTFNIPVSIYTMFYEKYTSKKQILLLFRKTQIKIKLTWWAKDLFLWYDFEIIPLVLFLPNFRDQFFYIL